MIDPWSSSRVRFTYVVPLHGHTLHEDIRRLGKSADILDFLNGVPIASVL
jgi:hypothetical protein